MTLSKRESFLLFLLAWVAILGLMVAFVLLPQINKTQAKQLDLGLLEDKQAQVDRIVPLLEGQRKDLEARKQEVGTLALNIEVPMNEAQFDQWVLPLLLENKMTLIDATFDEPVVVSPQALETFYVAPTYQLQTWADEITGIVAENYTPPMTTNMILMSKHSYRVKGTYESYRKILNTVSHWDTSIYVAYTTYDFEKSEAIILFNVYMMEKIIDEENPKVYTIW